MSPQTSFGGFQKSMSAAYDVFKVDQDTNVLHNQNRHNHVNIGIFNGKITAGTPCDEALTVRDLTAPPYVSLDHEARCFFQGRIFGLRPRVSKYTWFPFMIEREGSVNGVTLRTSTVLVNGERAVIVAAELENKTGGALSVPLQIAVRGGLDCLDLFTFDWPLGSKACKTVREGRTLILRNNSGSIAVASDLDGLVWCDYSSNWETTLRLAGGEKKSFCFVMAIGPFPKTKDLAERVAGSWRDFISEAMTEWDRKVTDMFERVPSLESENTDLVHFYNRSLLPFLLNRWEVDEFVINPYYSTGGVNGGCIASYLWDYGNPAKMWPLFDPESNKKQIKQFLSIDLTSHYAFNPGTGEALGPWYPINQENIIALIYYYVILTGDRDFLNETVSGKTALEWALFHALHKDDLGKDAALADYGNGNNHLELRDKQYRYDYFMPDLNARRCLCLRRVADLHRLAGRKPPVNLIGRAAALGPLIKKELWDAERKWFAWMSGKIQGKTRDFRYTYQILEMFDTGALDAETEKGLLSHINDGEFLSDYGLHSISKKDPAYNQDDVDHGGGGGCSCIIPMIIEKLYKTGHSSAADDILGRILWWGKRLPYMTDSQFANYMAAREDSPLMNAVGALAGAQCVIWGLLGLGTDSDFSLTVNPRPTRLAKETHLKGLKIRSFNISVRLGGESYELDVNGSKRSGKPGIPSMIGSLKQ